jgi:serine/threonine-protein kinase
VFDHARGFPLSRLISRGDVLHARLVAGILVQLCDALQYVYTLSSARGPLHLVHRDISPSNVILRSDGVVKLIDFGVAQLFERSAALRLQVGKWGYMAPEHIRGDAVDRRADLYSSAVLALELALGRPALDNRCRDAAVAIDARRRLLPQVRLLPALGPVLADALALDPAARPCCARELGDAISEAVREHGGPATVRELAAEMFAPSAGAAGRRLRR